MTLAELELLKSLGLVRPTYPGGNQYELTHAARTLLDSNERSARTRAHDYVDAVLKGKP